MKVSAVGGNSFSQKLNFQSSKGLKSDFNDLKEANNDTEKAVEKAKNKFKKDDGKKHPILTALSVIFVTAVAFSASKKALDKFSDNKIVKAISEKIDGPVEATSKFIQRSRNIPPKAQEFLKGNVNTKNTLSFIFSIPAIACGFLDTDEDGHFAFEDGNESAFGNLLRTGAKVIESVSDILT